MRRGSRVLMLACELESRRPSAAQEHDEALDVAMAAAGIERWELYRVDNGCCDGAPLGVPDAGQSTNGPVSSNRRD